MVEELCDDYFNIITTCNDNDIINTRKIDFTYGPTSYQFLDSLFRKFKFNEDDYFIDYGCGKGRVIIMAAYHSCKHIYGCEINKERYSIVKNNIATFKEKFGGETDFCIENISADKMDINNKINKFFFFQPFHIKLIMKVMNNIRESLKKNNRNIILFLYRPFISTTNYFDSLIEFKRILYYECTVSNLKKQDKICLFAIYSNYDFAVDFNEETAAWII